MLDFAVLAAGLFIGFTVSTAGRESAYGYYLRYYTSAGLGRRMTAYVARGIAFIFAAIFYLCIGVGVCVLIAVAFMFMGYAYGLLAG